MYQGGRRRRSHDYLRSCDYCGRLVLRSSMVKKDNYLACKDDARGRERVTLDKANAANVTPRMWKPARSRLSDRDNEIDVYQADEAVAFNAIAVDGCVGADGAFRQGWAPYELIDTSGPGEGQPMTAPGALSETPRCAGWAAEYLYGVLSENKRPATWLTNATRKIRELADWLLGRQFVSSATSSMYGGFPRDGTAGSYSTVYAEDTAMGMLALLRAYQVTSTITYLLGARRSATCLRRMQCCGLRTSNYVVSDAGGGRFQPGAFPLYVLGSSPYTTTFSSPDFYPSDLVVCRALDVLATVDGDSTYGDATAVGEFAVPTAATVSQMIAQAVAWWQTGALDVTTGTTYTGLSATTPREFYRTTMSSSPGNPSWQYKWSDSANGYVTSLNYAKALWALYLIDESSSQVSTVSAWLRGLGGASSFATPNNYGILQDRTTVGTFDPTFAPPSEIAIPSSGAAAKVGAYYYMTTGAGQDASGNWLPGPSYDLAAAGLLSVLSTSPKTLKDAISKLRPRNWLRRESTAP